MQYTPDSARYDSMIYKRCGKSGLKFPAVSLGLWHNFGKVDEFENGQKMIRRAFDLGITHFDLANNYGPPAGSAEENFGRILKSDFQGYRDELLISTKAGWGMWPGPYGDFGSRKYLIASLDQSLKRMGLDYVDIFYHHRPDPETPLEETMTALDQIVRSGKALYVGISSYDAPSTRRAADILKELGTPCLIHQPQYNMFNRTIEQQHLEVFNQTGMGCIPFSPLAQGLLTDRYQHGIPKDSRASKSPFLRPEQVEHSLRQVKALQKIADKREQKLSQLAIAWILRLPEITSVLVGASRISQIEDAVGALNNLNFFASELTEIDQILAEQA
ncbi:MAG: L-glyceraldehyde 3-phosphate reductase [Fibrobacter sp.]|jgi:L-glyceraldehyde 3-phosphate reductase|nr:L-glyceraldehyde 3-phosphate reductase [Fibrobacter sp.]